jgi:predicted nucleic acid-binding protein
MPELKELVINTTPIISLIAATGALDMLPLLYSRVWVPFEVCQEIQVGGVDGFASVEFAQMNWLHKQDKPVNVSALLKNSLDAGEAAVIQLALQQGIPLVAIDETVGRRFARLSGLTVTGSIGILLRAKHLGYPLSMMEAIRRMRQRGIWLGDQVVEFALREAGEFQ